MISAAGCLFFRLVVPSGRRLLLHGQHLCGTISCGWRQWGNAAKEINREPLSADAADHAVSDFVRGNWPILLYVKRYNLGSFWHADSIV